MAGSFRVHLFDDPGVEIMPESNGCTCSNHNEKTIVNGCQCFHLGTKLGSRETVWGLILTVLVTLGTHVVISEGIVVEIVIGIVTGGTQG